MSDLKTSLLNHDLGFLNIIAECWGLALDAPSLEVARKKLLPAMLDQKLLEEVIQSLPGRAQEALHVLIQNGGALPWQRFTRLFGPIREMGAGRRDREKPHRNPASTSEVLWYHGVIARAFRDTPSGPVEYAFIPSDLEAILPDLATKLIPSDIRPATQSERSFIWLSDDRIIDHACTLLAALRLGLSFQSTEFLAGAWTSSSETRMATPEQLTELLEAAELIDSQNRSPIARTAQRFLETPRGKALALLARTWMHSTSFNELKMLPGLVFEGEWQNDPLQARYTILEFIRKLKPGTWWSLGTLVQQIKETQPDFQRPAGDYDSWFIRPEDSETYLRGFKNWDLIDGELIRFIITGPMYWLGMIDLAGPAAGRPPAAFRLSHWAEALLAGISPDNLPLEENAVLVSSDARLRAPRLVPRIARYQIARFSTWKSADENVYAYHLTPGSLKRAKDQGLRINHLLTILRRYALAVPPSLVRSLERWERYGSEAKIESALLLRLQDPDILKKLRKSRAARFLGDTLSPTVVIVKPGAWKQVLAALAELGYLGEAHLD